MDGCLVYTFALGYIVCLFDASFYLQEFPLMNCSLSLRFIKDFCFPFQVKQKKTTCDLFPQRLQAISVRNREKHDNKSVKRQ